MPFVEEELMIPTGQKNWKNMEVRELVKWRKMSYCTNSSQCGKSI